MKDSFEELAKFVRESIEYDEWVEDKGMGWYCDSTIKEVEEIKEALKNDDDINLREELGDVLSTWMHICVLAERQKDVNVKDMIQDAIAKLKRRKPFVEEKRRVGVEEALKIWLEVKEKEKEEKNKGYNEESN